MEVKKVKNSLIKQMKEMNTYNKNYNNIIEITARLLIDYEKAKEQFEKSGANITIEHTNKNGSKNLIKNPFYLAIEKLRDDVLVHLRELGLTPYGTKKLNIQVKEVKNSKLDEFLTSELV